PAEVVQAEDQSGDRRAEHGGQRDRGHEPADDASAIDRREPQGEVEDDAREEAGFGGAKQDADDVEAGLTGDGGHQTGQDAPGQHDPGDPLARAEPLEREVRWHLEDEIAEEEDPSAEAKGGG